MKLRDRVEAIRWFKQRVAAHVGTGKAVKEAINLAKAEGEKKFGAVDWAKIFELIQTILPLILALFGK